VEATLERAHELKQALIEFVLEAEGELAEESLETYAIAQSRRERHDSVQQDLIIDSFLTEAKVGDKDTAGFILESQPELSDERQLVSGWQRSFIGLFAVTQILPDGFELMNWLTAKHCQAKQPQTIE